jgi:hypothetical protein
MRRFCMSLCVLVLCSTTLSAEDNACQDSKSSAAKGFPCTCPLFDAGGFWVAEEHAAGTNCQNPMIVTLPGVFAPGICTPPGCSGNGCLARLTAKDEKPKSVLKKRLPIDGTPPPTKYVKYIDPRFVMIKFPDESITPIYAKVFTAVVNARQIAEDHKLELHPQRGDYHVLTIGYETTGIPADMDPQVIKQFSVMLDDAGKPKANEREVSVDFGLHKGCILLAP